MITPPVIDKRAPLPESQDYAFLRERGLEHIRALSGRIWTYHNLHDPGVTTLEVLCYALTDLGRQFREKGRYDPRDRPEADADELFFETGIRLVASMQVAQATKANLTAIAAIADRIDGKVAQAIELTGEDGGAVVLNYIPCLPDK